MTVTPEPHLDLKKEKSQQYHNTEIKMKHALSVIEIDTTKKDNVHNPISLSYLKCSTAKNFQSSEEEL